MATNARIVFLYLLSLIIPSMCPPYIRQVLFLSHGGFTILAFCFLFKFATDRLLTPFIKFPCVQKLSFLPPLLEERGIEGVRKTVSYFFIQYNCSHVSGPSFFCGAPGVLRPSLTIFVRSCSSSFSFSGYSLIRLCFSPGSFVRL